MAQQAFRSIPLASATIAAYDQCYLERSRPRFRISLRTMASHSILGQSRHRGWQFRP
jgi:hypothetical protein